LLILARKNSSAAKVAFGVRWRTAMAAAGKGRTAFSAPAGTSSVDDALPVICETITYFIVL
jgi:hypothetical protein